MVCKRLQRTGRLFVFLREHRHELFDEPFQAELAAMYSDKTRGTRPKPPALLAMVTLLQAYTGLSDAAAVEQAVFDRRWQMVLDCVGADRPPFSQGTLVEFRRRLIEHDLDQWLVERSVEIARKTGGFGHKALRASLDSSPLWGASRVEDTFNLIGHALDMVVQCVAAIQKVKVEEVHAAAGLQLLGHSSLKAALDIDWDEPEEQQAALRRLLDEVERLKTWLAATLPNERHTPSLTEALALLARVVEQDIEPDPDGGGPRIRRGVTKNRRISATDGDMRHGRESRSRVINGYKRHILVDLDTRLILGATVRPANEPEHAAAAALEKHATKFGPVEELAIDRGYLASEWVASLHERGVPVISKPWRSRNGGRYTKEQFQIDLARQGGTCPEGQTANIRPSRTASFSAAVCDACPSRSRPCRALWTWRPPSSTSSGSRSACTP
jgi:hypothetical protein